MYSLGILKAYMARDLGVSRQKSRGNGHVAIGIWACTSKAHQKEDSRRAASDALADVVFEGFPVEPCIVYGAQYQFQPYQSQPQIRTNKA